MAIIIKFVQHKGLKYFMKSGNDKRIPSELRKRVKQILGYLDKADNPEDLNIPGMQWRRYTKERLKTFSVDVNDLWQITYRWKNGHAVDVNLEQKR